MCLVIESHSEYLRERGDKDIDMGGWVDKDEMDAYSGESFAKVREVRYVGWSLENTKCLLIWHGIYKVGSKTWPESPNGKATPPWPSSLTQIKMRQRIHYGPDQVYSPHPSPLICVLPGITATVRARVWAPAWC